MNELKIFNNEEFQIRVIEIDNEPWFVGKDVAEILGYTNTRKALIDHVDEEDKGVTKCDTLGGKQEMTVINESGLYSLILSSKKPEAKQFKRWVTAEVLPAIRKHGVYATDNVIEEMLEDPDTMIKVLKELKKEREEKKQLEEQVQENAPKVLFANSVETSTNSCLIGELAKILKQNGIEIGQNKLFEWLRSNGYLIKQKGENYNLPTQYSMERGWMEIKKRTINNADGTIRTTKTTKITGKGQIYFVNKFLNREVVVNE